MNKEELPCATDGAVSKASDGVLHSKTPSYEISTEADFITAYLDFLKTALPLADKARKEGLLGLTNDIDQKKAGQRDIFHYGLKFAVGGLAPKIIDDILFNLVEQEEGLEGKFKFIQKQAVMHIQSGIGPEILRCILNSYTPISIEEQDRLVGNYAVGKSSGVPSAASTGNAGILDPDEIDKLVSKLI